MVRAAGAAALNPVTQRPWLHRRPLNIAHQGGEAEAPSSTMFALATAVDNGADALELDVHATADGHLVVLHDATVDRTTDGAGAVDTMTLDEIRRLDAAYWFVPGVGAVHGRGDGDYSLRGVARGDHSPPGGFTAGDFTVAALVDVFRRFPRTLINIDIKQSAPATRPYEQALGDLIADFAREDITMVASFSDDALQSFRALAPSVPTSATPSEVLAFWTAVQASALPPAPPRYHALQVPPTHDGITVVDAAFVDGAHHCGVAVHVWTIDDTPTMAALLDIGVDGIVTNRPTVLESVLVERFPSRRAPH